MSKCKAIKKSNNERCGNIAILGEYCLVHRNKEGLGFKYKKEGDYIVRCKRCRIPFETKKNIKLFVRDVK